VTTLPDGFEVLCEDSPIRFTDLCGQQVTGTPFYVQSTLVTTPVGVNEEQMRSILLQRLLAGEQGIVERAFDLRLWGTSPSLVNDVPVAVTLPAAASVVDGLGALETWLHTVGAQGINGVLHIPMRLAPRMEALGCMSMGPDRVWRTALGTPISFGYYSGTSATGGAPAAGHTYLYITGSTTIWRESDAQIEIPPHRGTVRYVDNELRAFARRGYVVTHNGLVACVDVVNAGP
jgi:hypothetical protein